ncbi:chemotaxis protein CheA [Phaeobacter sp. PT47_59]|uniref:chemotaxis protein CheA n=1 Tax=Phaeobacter sp. PT47_59 TaxID=3029979 RepID=UPI0023806D9A|nr:chemotaxis protein CheA [Phaeobacter sp. PT47_59]MDE4175655.1 chemotaxis protein CheA [Phaeobacter sp. PT47_59]
MIEQATEAFVLEARELLAELEDSFLELEDDVTSARIDEIFRALHTVKGSGSMFGYTALSRFTHHFENAYDLVRDGALQVERDLIDLSLAARDLMVSFLDLGGDGPEAEALLVSPEVSAIVERLSNLTGTSEESIEAPGKVEADAGETAAPAPTGVQTFLIRFTPAQDALRNGMRPDLLMRELADLGKIQVSLDVSAVPRLTELDPTEAVLGWIVELETAEGREAVEDVFIFADDADLSITEMTPEISVEETPAPETPATDSAEPAVAQVPAAAAPAPSQAAAQPKSEPKAKLPTAAKSESIRVTSSRLDDMMDALGELVIAQARLEAVSEEISDPTLETVVEDVQRLVMGLRDATLSIRMLPIESVFGKFRRVVRDLSADLGKDIRLITEGGETEIDKNVIDRISEPLVHMIRNSVDHGLETAEDRQAQGKTPQGSLWLSACQEGGEILVSIEDNGKGLDAEAIRARAIERELIDPEAELSEQDLHHLIFEPGFSTAKVVSSVSGRGVGMDAVKTTIDALGGSIHVLSRAGQGTRITLRLPVTMAIIDGLRVRLGESVYVIPLSAVEECVEMDEAESKRDSGRSLLQIRDEMVPYLELDALFGQTAKPDAGRRVVVVRVDGMRAGLVVDDILGQSQTVIKGLSAYHKDIPGLGGATILGDGRVALIIDVATLIRWAETRRDQGPRKAA